jgi:hypothetical protein
VIGGLGHNRGPQLRIIFPIEQAISESINDCLVDIVDIAGAYQLQIREPAQF